MRRTSLLTVLCATFAFSTGAAPPAAPPTLAERATAALSQVRGRIALAGLDEPVEVLRDRWGVAHVYAQSAHDLFFAQGFVVAQDRMWQLEMWRRNGEGRLAEVLGSQYVTRDKFARLLALCLAVIAAGTFTAWAAGRAAAGRDAVLAVKEDW